MFVPILVTCLVASAWGTANATDQLTRDDFNIPDPSHHLGQQDQNGTCYDASSLAGCTLCKLVIKYIKKELGEETTREKVRQALLTVCSKIPKFVKEGCDYFVDKYSDLIIPFILDHISPKLICQNIKLCKKAFDLEIYRGVKSYPNDVPQVSSACSICKYLKMIVGEEKMKGKNAEQIHDALENMCFQLPQALRYECMSMAIIIESIPVQIPNFEVCQTICFTVPDEPSTHLAPNQCGVRAFKSVTCDSCVSIMNAIKSAVGSATEAEIIAELDVLCLETGPLAPFCMIIVTASGAVIAYLIVNGVSSEAICQKIALC